MMKRRNFIIYTAYATAAAAVSLPFSGCSGPDAELDKKLAIPEILAKTYDEKTIREIGAAYGKAYPEEYNIKDLERLLRKNAENKTVSASTPVAELNAIMSNQVRNDFKTGQSIVLNGWVLSLTEARQCALYTLIPNN